MAALGCALLSGVKMNAALCHLILLISVLLEFVRWAEGGLSCYNNPNRLSRQGGAAGGEEKQGPISQFSEAVGGWASSLCCSLPPWRRD